MGGLPRPNPPPKPPPKPLPPPKPPLNSIVPAPTPASPTLSSSYTPIDLVRLCRNLDVHRVQHPVEGEPFQASVVVSKWTARFPGANNIITNTHIPILSYIIGIRTRFAEPNFLDPGTLSSKIGSGPSLLNPKTDYYQREAPQKFEIFTCMAPNASSHQEFFHMDKKNKQKIPQSKTDKFAMKWNQKFDKDSKQIDGICAVFV
uniref:Uncharacterized protein n=1 Tax=Romanomermis culicivorax TaxID=13658 RepID=A0A915L638_ROMCU